MASEPPRLSLFQVSPLAVVSVITFASAGVVLLLEATPVERATVLRTIALGLTASWVAIPIAGLAAWAARPKTFVSRCLLFTLIGLCAMPPYLLVSFWDAALGKLGWLTSARGQVLQPLLAGWNAAVWVHAVGFVPQFALLFLLAMRMGRVYEEQATLVGSAASVFWHITMPRLWPLIWICQLWAVIVCSRVIAITDLYQIGTIAEQIYLGYSLGQLNSMSPTGLGTANSLADVAAAGLPTQAGFCLLLMAVSMWLFASVAKLQSSVLQPNSTSDKAMIVSDGVLRSIAALTIFTLIAAAPVFNLIYRAGLVAEEIDGQFVQYWSAGGVAMAFERIVNDHRDAFLWSAIIGACSATITFFAGAVLSYLSRRSVVCRLFLLISVVALASLSGPAIGSSLSEFLASEFLIQPEFRWLRWLYDRTIVPAVVANAAFCFPLAAMLIWVVYRNIPSDQTEHAQLDQIGWFRQIVEFGFKQNAWLNFGIWLLVFVISFTELSATQILLPPGIETLAQVTLGKLHSGVDEATAVLALLTGAVVVAISLIGCIIGRLGFR